MSKNKKNVTQKTTTCTLRNNTLTIILIAAIVLVAVAGTILLLRNPPQQATPTAPVVSVEQNAAGNDTEDMARYLKEKYNMDFVHEFTSAGASVFSADSLPGLIQVFRREVVQTFDEAFADKFTDIYADNGYMIVNMNKAVDYYKDKLSGDFGNHTFLTYIDIVANPSSVTAETPYTVYLTAISNMSIPHLIILTDKVLTDEEKATLTAEISTIKTPVAVRVFTLDKETQSEVTPGDIMQLGSGYKDVQYYNIFNAEHLLGK